MSRPKHIFNEDSMSYILVHDVIFKIMRLMFRVPGTDAHGYLSNQHEEAKRPDPREWLKYSLSELVRIYKSTKNYKLRSFIFYLVYMNYEYYGFNRFSGLYDTINLQELKK